LDGRWEIEGGPRKGSRDERRREDVGRLRGRRSVRSWREGDGDGAERREKSRRGRIAR
jgi:hypothetical protein